MKQNSKVGCRKRSNPQMHSISPWITLKRENLSQKFSPFDVHHFEPIFAKGMRRSTFQWKRVFQWKGGRQFRNEGFGKDFYRKGNSVKEVRAIQWTAGLWKLKSCCPHPLPENQLLIMEKQPRGNVCWRWPADSTRTTSIPPSEPLRNSMAKIHETDNDKEPTLGGHFGPEKNI